MNPEYQIEMQTTGVLGIEHVYGFQRDSALSGYTIA